MRFISLEAPPMGMGDYPAHPRRKPGFLNAHLTGIEKYPAGYILGKEIRKSRIFRFAKKVRRRNKRNKIYKKSTDCL
jgi:hypothetical protein